MKQEYIRLYFFQFYVMGLRHGPCPGVQRKWWMHLRGGLRQIYFPIEDEKGWRMRYSTEIYDLYEDEGHSIYQI